MAEKKQQRGLVERAYPVTTGMWRAAKRDGVAAAAAGDYPRALGAGFRAVGGVPIGIAGDVIQGPVSDAVSGLRSFLGGLVGSSGSEKVTVRAPQAKAAAKTKAVENPVDEALKQGGKAEETPITPHDLQLAFIHSMLSRKQGVSMREFRALTEALPAGPKAPTLRDQKLSEVSDIAGAVYQQELMDAKKTSKSEKEYAERFQKASDRYFRNAASLFGANPQALAIADMVEASNRPVD